MESDIWKNEDVLYYILLFGVFNNGIFIVFIWRDNRGFNIFNYVG